MTLGDHLSEEHRHGFADRSLSGEQQTLAADHIELCDACRADVARLERLVKTARSDRPAVLGDEALDVIWRGVRTSVEERKIVPLAANAEPASDSRSAMSRRRRIVGVAAAVVLFSTGVLIARRAAVRQGDDTVVTTGPALSTVAESTQVYQQEIQILLNELELRRALLRPETAASIDQSLRVIDQAIGELRNALVRDPNNPALRQLLASSYRQKVDLLKRVGNAG